MPGWPDDSFCWKELKLHWSSEGSSKPIPYQSSVWNWLMWVMSFGSHSQWAFFKPLPAFIGYRDALSNCGSRWRALDGLREGVKKYLGRGTRGVLTCVAVRLCCEEFLRSLKSFSAQNLTTKYNSTAWVTWKHLFTLHNATEDVCIVEGFVSEANYFWHLSQIWGWI